MDAFWSLILTTALLLGSPGPAPLALAGIGASFGFKQGIHFLLGILGALLVVIVVSAGGLGALFNTYPALQWTCQLIGTGYLLYVAYKIASGKGGISAHDGKAPSFKDGFILNLINPKAYAAFLAIFANSTLDLGDYWRNVLVTGLVCFFVAVIVDGLWMLAGGSLRTLLNKPKQAITLRWGFALALVVSLAVSYT